MNEHSYALGEMDRRLGNLLRFGTVSQVDYVKALVKVNLGDLVTDWLPWATTSAGQDRVWKAPDVGEQVVLLSPGDPSQGVVIGSVFQTAHPANGSAGKDWRITFKDGTVIEFDRDASALNVTLKSTGTAKIKVGATELQLQDGQATMKATAITLDGNVTITGTTSVQAITAGGKNIGGTHTHSGVQTGGGTTGAPT